MLPKFLFMVIVGFVPTTFQVGVTQEVLYE
jgi:hypothetical protein